MRQTVPGYIPSPVMSSATTTPRFEAIADTFDSPSIRATWKVGLLDEIARGQRIQLRAT
jgi:hypothetical protein